MLTGEYAVLDGAEALALPTKFGQRMLVKSSKGSNLVWESLDKDGESWFSAVISLFDFSASKTEDTITAKRLEKFLKNAVRLNSEFLSKWNGFKVETQLEFPQDWGLGSSSTLIHLMAQWADINPVMLALNSTNGSGYDVACAGSDGPIVYKSDDESVSFSEVDFNPSFKDKLYFVHLGRKQNSEEEIIQYLKTAKKRKALVNKLSSITDQILEAKSLSEFEKLIDQHEEIVSESLKRIKVKDELFSDYWGSMKSLGAWGGDFIIATSSKSSAETISYFEEKGFPTILPYNDLILESE